MLKIILVLGLSFSFQAGANTQIIFGKDGQKVTVPLLTFGNDNDARRLYDLIAMAPELEQGKWTKKVAFSDSSGNRLMSLVCVFSTQVQYNGSCVLVVNQGPGVQINPSQRQFSYHLDGSQALLMSQIFNVPTVCGVIYQSNDDHLKLSCEKDPATTMVNTFLIQYQ